MSGRRGDGEVGGGMEREEELRREDA